LELFLIREEVLLHVKIFKLQIKSEINFKASPKKGIMLL